MKPKTRERMNLVIRVSVFSVLIYLIYKEAGKWTAIFAFLISLDRELNYWVMKEIIIARMIAKVYRLVPFLPEKTDEELNDYIVKIISGL